MVPRPRPELEINPLQQQHVTRVVSLHDTPGVRVPGHAAEPQMLSCMRELPTDPERSTQVVQSVAVELEIPPGDLEGIDRLERSRGL
jgi:hypothetical protein